MKYIDPQNFQFYSGLPHSIAAELDAQLQRLNGVSGYGRWVERLVQKNSGTVHRHQLERFVEENIVVHLKHDQKTLRITYDIARSDSATEVMIRYFAVEPESGKSHSVAFPIQPFLKGWGKITGCIGYYHDFYRGNEPLGMYIGITKHTWAHRYSQHLKNAFSGSQTLFHKMLRYFYSASEPLHKGHTMRVVDVPYNDVMYWEESAVDHNRTLAPHGLNMIPGGFKGIRELYKLGMLKSPEIANEEEIQDGIEKYSREHPRKGIANPKLSELWQTDEHYRKVVLSREKSLSVQQVREIRCLSLEGHSIQDITELVGALNSTQVKNVLNDKTYTRI